LLSLALLLTAAACGQRPEPAAPPESPRLAAPVATAALETRSVLYEATGSVRARSQATLASKLMGMVRRVHVREGQTVRAGQILVEIDPRQVKAQLQGAEAARAEAENGLRASQAARDGAQAAAALAGQTHERYRQMLADKAVSRQEYDEIDARWRQAQSGLAQAEAMLAAASHRLAQAEAGRSAAGVSDADAQVAAPFDAAIIARLVEPGDLAVPGTPLVRLEGREGFRVDVVVPEAYQASLRPDQPLAVTLPAISPAALAGALETVVPAADPRSRTVALQVRLPDDPRLRSGMFARVSIPVAEAGQILVPRAALVRQGQLTGLFLLDSQALARFRLVRTGIEVGERVEVLAGVNAGERYVLQPPPAMVDGTPVESRP
jgi:RND family efflux transporter MFP subunit